LDVRGGKLPGRDWSGAKRVEPTMIRTLARVICGFALACLAAGLTTVLFVTTPGELLAAPTGEFAEKAGQTFVWGLLAATHSAIFAAAFALIALGVGEWLSLRGAGYYMLAGLIIALLGFYAQFASEAPGQATILNTYAATAFVCAGLISGLVYWLIAGRNAGQNNRDKSSVEVVELKPETTASKL
jgi:hypothetical protein